MFFTVEDAEAIKYTIPLSLAGLFLTGSMFDVVNNGDTLYESTPINSVISETQIKMFTTLSP